MELRHQNNLPAKAIQWGPIAEVGVFDGSKNIIEFPQPISSCLQVLDQLLIADDTIVSSWCLTDKMSLDISSKRITATLFNVLRISDN